MKFFALLILTFSYILAVCYSFLIPNINETNLCTDKNGKPIEGTKAYKLDCSKYLECLYGEVLVRNCPFGLLFNERAKICDWPRNANCTEFEAKDNEKLVIPATDIGW